MNKNKIIILLCLLVIAGCGLFKTADDLYSEAEIKRNSGEPMMALTLLEKIIKKHADHEKAPEIGRAHV